MRQNRPENPPSESHVRDILLGVLALLFVGGCNLAPVILPFALHDLIGHSAAIMLFFVLLAMVIAVWILLFRFRLGR